MVKAIAPKLGAVIMAIATFVLGITIPETEVVPEIETGC
jgi:hypothetical protein